MASLVSCYANRKAQIYLLRLYFLVLICFHVIFLKVTHTSQLLVCSNQNSKHVILVADDRVKATITLLVKRAICFRHETNALVEQQGSKQSTNSTEETGFVQCIGICFKTFKWDWGYLFVYYLLIFCFNFFGIFKEKVSKWQQFLKR